MVPSAGCDRSAGRPFPHVLLPLQLKQETAVSSEKEESRQALEASAGERGAGPEADGQGMLRCLRTHSGNNPPATFCRNIRSKTQASRRHVAGSVEEAGGDGRKHPTTWPRASLRKAGLPVE